MIQSIICSIALVIASICGLLAVMHWARAWAKVEYEREVSRRHWDDLRMRDRFECDKKHLEAKGE